MYILKKHGENINNPSIRICVRKTEYRITFKIKTEYSLELLTLETMKLLESTENKITNDKNSKNVLHLEITEVVLVHFNIVNIMIISKSQEFCIHLFRINHSVVY